MEDLKVNEQTLEDLTLETENIYGDDDDFVEQNIGLFINEVFSFQLDITYVIPIMITKLWVF